MQIDKKPNIAFCPVFGIEVLPRSNIESAHDTIRGPAIDVLKSNGIRNPRRDILPSRNIAGVVRPFAMEHGAR